MSDPSSVISSPGPNWRLRWLDGPILDHLTLDVVGFLAILGEDAVKATSKLASLSWIFCLPRLLPAPHCLLYAERPEEHDVVRAMVTGVFSGNHRNELSSVTAGLFGSMPAYTVRCFEISRKLEAAKGASRLCATYFGPVILVNLFGCLISIVLLIASLVYGDGFSLVATILLSALSTLVGLTNHWTWRLGGSEIRHAPPGDTVIRWPNGSFLVIKCEESIAREMFFPQNHIDYTLRWANGFMFVSLAGTVILMISVIMLANARIQLQLAWGGAYILLNIGHWLAAALPKRLNWDFSAYLIQERTLLPGPQSANFTMALWKTIACTRTSDWVQLNEAAPRTDVWAEWLSEAQTVAQDGIVEQEKPVGKHSSFHKQTSVDAVETELVFRLPDWDPKKAWDGILAASERNGESHDVV